MTTSGRYKVPVQIKCHDKDFYEKYGLPERKTSGSAGYDVRACIDKSIRIMPGECEMIPLGISILTNDSDFGIFFYSRSGLSSKFGINLINGVGVIDSDYEGGIKAPLFNHSDLPYTIQIGERVGQLIVQPVYAMEFTVVDELTPIDKNGRGVGGFGSTGKN